MYEIRELTPEQIGRIPEHVERWTRIGLSTEPADRPAAEEGVRLAYRIAGMKPPRKIVWCGSPLAQSKARILLARQSANESMSMRKDVWQAVGQDVWQAVGQDVWQAVRQDVWQDVWQAVGQAVWNSVWQDVWQDMYGQQDAAWLAFHAFFREVCGLKEETEKLTGLLRITESAGWWMPYENVCFICERHHRLHRDERGRLHCADGPAVAYPDGFSIWAWHGVRVPAAVIEAPADLSPKQIDEESNAEVRRVMIDRFGPERYLREGGAVKVHADERGTLWRKEVAEDEPLVMIEVDNSTPEADGTRKHYFLRVPPTMTRASEAVAWTFGRSEHEYAPTVET